MGDQLRVPSSTAAAAPRGKGKRPHPNSGGAAVVESQSQPGAEKKDGPRKRPSKRVRMAAAEERRRLEEAGKGVEAGKEDVDHESKGEKETLPAPKGKGTGGTHPEGKDVTKTSSPDDDTRALLLENRARLVKGGQSTATVDHLLAELKAPQSGAKETPPAALPVDSPATLLALQLLERWSSQPSDRTSLLEKQRAGRSHLSSADIAATRAHLKSRSSSILRASLSPSGSARVSVTRPSSSQVHSSSPSAAGLPAPKSSVSKRDVEAVPVEDESDEKHSPSDSDGEDDGAGKSSRPAVTKIAIPLARYAQLRPHFMFPPSDAQATKATEALSTKAEENANPHLRNNWPAMWRTTATGLLHKSAVSEMRASADRFVLDPEVKDPPSRLQFARLSSLFAPSKVAFGVDAPKSVSARAARIKPWSSEALKRLFSEVDGVVQDNRRAILMLAWLSANISAEHADLASMVDSMGDLLTHSTTSLTQFMLGMVHSGSAPADGAVQPREGEASLEAALASLDATGASPPSSTSTSTEGSATAGAGKPSHQKTGAPFKKHSKSKSGRQGGWKQSSGHATGGQRHYGGSKSYRDRSRSSGGKDRSRGRSRERDLSPNAKDHRSKDRDGSSRHGKRAN